MRSPPCRTLLSLSAGTMELHGVGPSAASPVLVTRALLVLGRGWAVLMTMCVAVGVAVTFSLLIVLCVAVVMAKTFSFRTAMLVALSVAVTFFLVRVASFLLHVLQKSRSKKGEY